MTRNPAPRRPISPTQFAAVVASVIGLVAGILTLYVHLILDPLTDVQAYWLAGQRLNEGEPHYPPGIDVNGPQYYFYPPLLAILFRPLALLPLEVAAAIWGAAMLAALVATLWIIGLRSARTWAAVCILAAPIAWTLTIGQAQSLVTLLDRARRAVVDRVRHPPPSCSRPSWPSGGLDRGAGGRWDWFVGWTVGLALLQLVLEPANSIAFLRQTTLQLVGNVNNLSPYAISPLLWAGLLAAGILLALRLAPTRWGWPAAVALSVLATPRLLLYVLSTLLAALADPRRGLPREDAPSLVAQIRRRGPGRGPVEPVD